MDRRIFLLLACAFPGAVLANQVSAATDCPICGGKLVPAGSVPDQDPDPSPNLDLWNGSYHGPFWPFHSPESPFCTRCNAAYAEQLGWSRSTVSFNSFYVPLCPEISNFPISLGRVKGLRTVYSQTFKGQLAKGRRKESVSYWAHDSRALRQEAQSYCQQYDLVLELDSPPSQPGQVYINASTRDDRFQSASEARRRGAVV